MTEELLYNAVRFEEVSEQLRGLWREAFGDSDEYIDAFFECFAVDDVLHTLSLGNRVVSALYALPVILKVGDAVVRSAYLYAVATRREYRGMGCMAELMRCTHDKLQQEGYDAVLLLPADEALAGYYARFGYRFCAGRKENIFSAPCDVPPYQLEECGDCSFEVLKFARECADFNHTALLPDVARFSMNITLCRMSGGGVYLLRLGGEIAGMAYVIKDGEGYLVLSAMAVDEEIRNLVLALLCHRLGVRCLRFLSPDADGTPFAMIKMLDGTEQLSNIHMELMLDK